MDAAHHSETIKKAVIDKESKMATLQAQVRSSHQVCVHRPVAVRRGAFAGVAGSGSIRKQPATTYIDVEREAVGIAVVVLTGMTFILSLSPPARSACCVGY